jgi:hypothetical protein
VADYNSWCQSTDYIYKFNPDKDQNKNEMRNKNSCTACVNGSSGDQSHLVKGIWDIKNKKCIPYENGSGKIDQKFIITGGYWNNRFRLSEFA